MLNGLQPVPRPMRTAITEAELNSFFTYYFRDQLPPGVVEPSVTILGMGRLSGQAVVDFDVVRKERGPGGWLDPWGYVWGRVPVTVTGLLEARDGVGQFRLESAEVSGLSVPRPLVLELVAFYSRTPDNPQGIDLDAPFELPARIRRIEMGRGEAVVVQ